MIPASWVLIPCPTCDGEGYVETEVAGGYYDMNQECWFPQETFISCPKCNADGMIEVTFDLQDAA